MKEVIESMSQIDSRKKKKKLTLESKLEVNSFPTWGGHVGSYCGGLSKSGRWQGPK